MMLDGNTRTRKQCHNGVPVHVQYVYCRPFCIPLIWDCPFQLAHYLLAVVLSSKNHDFAFKRIALCADDAEKNVTRVFIFFSPNFSIACPFIFIIYLLLSPFPLLLLLPSFFWEKKRFGCKIAYPSYKHTHATELQTRSEWVNMWKHWSDASRINIVWIAFSYAC